MDDRTTAQWHTARRWRELHGTEASFREDVDHCCECCEPQLQLYLRTVPDEGSQVKQGRVTRNFDFFSLT